MSKQRYYLVVYDDREDLCIPQRLWFPNGGPPGSIISSNGTADNGATLFCSRKTARAAIRRTALYARLFEDEDLVHAVPHLRVIACEVQP